MKFKNDKTYYQPARSVSLKDHEDDVLKVTVFETKYHVVVGINDDLTVGMTKAKAVKLAWAILDELDPCII